MLHHNEQTGTLRRLRVRFPPNSPIRLKAFNMSFDMTVSETIRYIAESVEEEKGVAMDCARVGLSVATEHESAYSSDLLSCSSYPFLPLDAPLRRFHRDIVRSMFLLWQPMSSDSHESDDESHQSVTESSDALEVVQKTRDRSESVLSVPPQPLKGYLYKAGKTRRFRRLFFRQNEYRLRYFSKGTMCVGWIDLRLIRTIRSASDDMFEVVMNSDEVHLFRANDVSSARQWINRLSQWKSFYGHTHNIATETTSPQQRRVDHSSDTQSLQIRKVDNSLEDDNSSLSASISPRTGVFSSSRSRASEAIFSASKPSFSIGRRARARERSREISREDVSPQKVVVGENAEENVSLLRIACLSHDRLRMKATSTRSIFKHYRSRIQQLVAQLTPLRERRRRLKADFESAQSELLKEETRALESGRHLCNRFAHLMTTVDEQVSALTEKYSHMVNMLQTYEQTQDTSHVLNCRADVLSFSERLSVLHAMLHLASPLEGQIQLLQSSCSALEEDIDRMNELRSEARETLRARKEDTEALQSQSERARQLWEMLSASDTSRGELSGASSAMSASMLTQLQQLCADLVDEQESADVEAEEVGEDEVIYEDQDTPNVDVSSSASQRAVVRAATLRVCLKLIVSGDKSIAVKDFLCCFRSVVQPVQLMSHLLELFCSSANVVVNPSNGKRTHTTFTPERLRLLNFIKKWIQMHPIDFSSTTDVYLLLIPFISNTLNVCGFSKIGLQLRAIIDELPSNCAKVNTKSALVSFSAPLTRSSMHILDVSSAELARQITLIDEYYATQLQYRDFIGCAWSSKDLKDKVELLGADAAKECGDLAGFSILRMINSFNNVSGSFVRFVLDEEQVDRRTRVIQKLLEVCDRLLQLRNYNGLMQLYGCLGHSAVARLTKSWAAVPKPLLRTRDNVAQLLSRNYAELRSVMRREQAPAVPYFGMSLTDLTFLEEMPSFLRGNLINVRKWRRQSEAITACLRFQLARYPFKPVQEIIWLILGNAPLSDDAAFERSLYLEPRT